MTEKTEFKTIYEKSKNEWKENLNIIFKISLVLAFLDLINNFIFWNSTKFKSLSIITIKSTISNNFSYTFILSIFLNLLILLISIIFFIYLFKLITNNKISLKDSSKYMLKHLWALILTYLIFLGLSIGFFILLIIPGFIFIVYSIFWGFAVLFREKKYISSIKYSYNLIKNNWWRTVGYYFIIYLIIFILNFLILFVSVLFKNNWLYLFVNSLSFIIRYFLLVFILIFTINYFLYLEKEKEIPNELSQDITSENENSNLSKNELTAKQYIEKYKDQYLKNAIETGLVNNGIPKQEVENYLNKYF